MACHILRVTNFFKMKRLYQFIVLIMIASGAFAQDNSSFFATMSLLDAKELSKELPEECIILDQSGNEAAVYMTMNASHKLHDRILVHGPGYIFRASKEAAIEALRREIPQRDQNRMPFTITEDVWVNQAIDLVSVSNIEAHILELEAYGTRYHTRNSAIQAANDLKTKWEDMAAAYGRSDVTVRLYNHNFTTMPSVIMTITGTEFPDEFVIVGGHLDSTANPSNDDAPGADDDASGIATITEAVRAMFEVDFTPQRTIEVMAYAAEEIGLVGSNEIAQDYSVNNVDVTAYVQFDMTNYNGSAQDVYYITDYTSGVLNSYLMDLMDHYNASGAHTFTYGTSLCNYGCSDHASWHNEGFMAAFPFESSFGQHNPNIHTPNDTFSVSGTAEHAAKFTKLCVEFLIETSKAAEILNVNDFAIDSYDIWVSDNTLNYEFTNGTNSEQLIVYDINGKVVRSVSNTGTSGTVQLDNLVAGIYIATFRTSKFGEIAQKIIIR